MAFDPYWEWLGIPSADQPPTHYRLLGIEQNVADDAVSAAAQRVRAWIHENAPAARRADADRLLRQVSEAEACLLNPERRAEYERMLQAATENKPSTAASSGQPKQARIAKRLAEDTVGQSSEPSLDAPSPALSAGQSSAPTARAQASAQRRRRQKATVIAAVAGAAVILAGGAALFWPGSGTLYAAPIKCISYLLTARAAFYGGHQHVAKYWLDQAFREVLRANKTDVMQGDERRVLLGIVSSELFDRPLGVQTLLYSEPWIRFVWAQRPRFISTALAQKDRPRRSDTGTRGPGHDLIRSVGHDVWVPATGNAPLSAVVTAVL